MILGSDSMVLEETSGVQGFGLSVFTTGNRSLCHVSLVFLVSEGISSEKQRVGSFSVEVSGVRVCVVGVGGDLCVPTSVIKKIETK